MREKHCWLAGGWRLLLEWCERKTLLAGAGAEQQNRVIDVSVIVAPKLDALGCHNDELH